MKSSPNMSLRHFKETSQHSGTLHTADNNTVVREIWQPLLQVTLLIFDNPDGAQVRLHKVLASKIACSPSSKPVVTKKQTTTSKCCSTAACTERVVYDRSEGVLMNVVAEQ